LLIFKEFAESQSVITVAGCPIATSFWEPSTSNKFALMTITTEKALAYLNLWVTHQQLKFEQEMAITDIVELIKQSKTFDILQFKAFLVEAKYVLPRRFLFGPKYRPVYFLLKM
jgi:hypothetical protein